MMMLTDCPDILCSTRVSRSCSGLFRDPQQLPHEPSSFPHVRALRRRGQTEVWGLELLQFFYLFRLDLVFLFYYFSLRDLL